MSGCHNPYVVGHADCSYYGRYEPSSPVRTLADDILTEAENHMLTEMKEMEARIKRHVTECKHEVIKEMMSIFCIPKPKIKKEAKNVKQE